MEWHSMMERLVVLGCGIVIGLIAGIIARPPEGGTHDHARSRPNPAEVREQGHPEPARRATATEPGDLPQVQEEPAQPSAVPRQTEAEVTAAAPESSGVEAEVAGIAKADPWYGRDPTPTELDDATRMRRLDKDSRLPLQPFTYMNRSYRSRGAFVPMAQGMAGVRTRAGPMTAARIVAPGATDEVREKLRLELWNLEERRRKAEIELVERQNDICKSPASVMEQIPDAEFWFTRGGDLFILRSGRDPDHARLLDALNAVDEEIAALKKSHLDAYGPR